MISIKVNRKQDQSISEVLMTVIGSLATCIHNGDTSLISIEQPYGNKHTYNIKGRKKRGTANIYNIHFSIDDNKASLNMNTVRKDVKDTVGNALSNMLDIEILNNQTFSQVIIATQEIKDFVEDHLPTFDIMLDKGFVSPLINTLILVRNTRGPIILMSA